jgi:hypothetical protein
MDAHPDVDRLIQATQRYEFSDGLRDLQLALLFLVGGVMAWLSFEPRWLAFGYSLSLAWGRWAIWILMLPALAGPLVVLAMLWVMRVVRQRWLWRETGMVTATRWMVTRRINAISAALLVVSLAVAFGLRQLGWLEDAVVLRVLWAATGWSFGYTMAAMGRRLALTRYVWLGVAGGLLSTLALLLPLSFGQLTLLFAFTWGLALAASGLVTLRQAAHRAAAA